MRNNRIHQVINQQPCSVIYVTCGKMQEIADYFRSRSEETLQDVCIFLSDWHVLDHAYALTVKKVVELLKVKGLSFKVIFTSAFKLSAKLETDIGFTDVPTVEFKARKYKYRVIDIPGRLDLIPSRWLKEMISIIEEVHIKRHPYCSSILVTALSEQYIAWLFKKLTERLRGVTVVPLSSRTVSYFRNTSGAKTTPRIILATEVAFTGLTIDDCDLIITCGLSRRPLWNTVTDLMELHDSPSTFQKALQVYGRCGRTRTGTVLSLQSYDFRHNRRYTRNSKDIIYPNPSDLVCDVARSIADTHTVTMEDFFGFGYDDRVEHCLDIIYQSTGLINDTSVPMKKAKIILSFANYCSIDQKVAYTLSMLKGLDCEQGANYVCTLAAVMETENIIQSSFIVKLLCSDTAQLLQLRTRDKILKQLSEGRFLGFGGDAYQIIEIVNRLAKQSDNILCVDTKAVEKIIKKRRYIFKNWEKYEGSNVCVAYSNFTKKFRTQKESRTRHSILFLLQMSLASSHHLQLAYLESGYPPCWAQAYILHSNYPIIVDS